MVRLPRSWFLSVAVAAVLGLAPGCAPRQDAPPPEEPAAAASVPAPQPSLEPIPWASPEPEPSPSAPPARSAPAPSPTATVAAAPTEREAVRGYLAAMDPHVQAVAAAVNGDSLADAVVAEAAQADPRGLRQILATCEEARTAIRAIRPPAPCAAHHAAALDVVDSAMSLVAQLGAEVLTPMQETPYDNSAAAANLKRKVQHLQALRAELAAQFGL